METKLTKKVYNQKRDTIIKLWAIKLRETPIVEQNLIEALGYSMAKWDFISKSPTKYWFFTSRFDRADKVMEVFKILRYMISNCPLCNHIRHSDYSCDSCPLMHTPLQQCSTETSLYYQFSQLTREIIWLIDRGTNRGIKSKEKKARKIATDLRDVLYELYLDEMMEEDSKACSKC